MDLTRILELDDTLDLFGDDSGADPQLIAAGLACPLPVANLGRPTLVWGWRVVRTALAHGLSSLEVRELELDWSGAVELAVRLEGRPGKLSFDEQIALVQVADRASVVLSDATSELARGDRGLVDIVSRILALPRHLADLVREGSVDLKVAERVTSVPAVILRRHDAEIRALSHSRRRQFLELVAEVVRRDDLAESEAERLSGEAFAGVDPVEHLRRLRFPTLTNMEERFKIVADREFRGTGVDVVAPPYFEGDAFSVQFSFRSSAELETRLNAADRLRGCCEELLGLL